MAKLQLAQDPARMRCARRIRLRCLWGCAWASKSGNVEGNHGPIDPSVGTRSIDVEQRVEARGQHDVERSGDADAEFGGTPVASECERHFRATDDGIVEPGV